MPSQIEKDFHKEMVSIYTRAKAEVNYPANRYIQLVSEHGGLEAAKILINSDAPSDGYTELWKRERLDLTVEALVIQGKWSSLFEPAEISKAKKRLEEYGYSAM